METRTFSSEYHGFNVSHFTLIDRLYTWIIKFVIEKRNPVCFRVFLSKLAIRFLKKFFSKIYLQ